MSEDSSPQKNAIGISFGNSYSSIAHINPEGKVEVIANEEGDRQIPTILSYVDGEEYHGTQAKAQLVRNAQNTIAYFRDYVGKSYKQIDPTHCRASAKPEDKSGDVVFKVQSEAEGQKSDLSVADVSTRYLKVLKKSASDYTGKDINAAVVTIPTDTNEEQQAAIKKAASAAGMEILQFIKEPIAAILAYDSRNPQSVQDRVVVVADFGATRSDAAVVVANGGGLYSILATVHDYETGGTLLDNVLVDHFAKEFEKKHKSDPRKNERSLAKLKLESENVKKALSQSQSAAFSVESLDQGIDFRSTVNRARYQSLALRAFQKFTGIITQVIQKAGLDVLDVEEIILSGGSSHTPKIAENVQSLFDSKKTTVYAPSVATGSLNPSELSARGAAIQASMIQEFEKEDIEQSTHEMVTVTPHTQFAIGVQVTGQKEDEMSIVVPATTAVPVRKTATVKVPQEGDALLIVSEAESSIKVTQPEKKSKVNGATVEDAKDTDEEEDDDDDEEEEEEIREKVWKAKRPLGEFVFRGLKKGTTLEVTINVGGDLAVQITAREAKGKGGIRGTLEKPEVIANGKA